MKHKVIVWGTGVVGKLVIRELLDHPEFELVGVIVHNPEKDGADVGTLIGVEPVGLAATIDSEAALAVDADAVAYFGPTAEFAVENIANMSRSLLSGKHVVSTSMTPLVYRRCARKKCWRTSKRLVVKAESRASPRGSILDLPTISSR